MTEIRNAVFWTLTFSALRLSTKTPLGGVGRRLALRYASIRDRLVALAFSGLSCWNRITASADHWHMLNLQLRDEFNGSKLKGPTIDLSDNKAGGVLKRPASEFLGVTYPSTDLLRMVESVQPAQTRAVVLLGGKASGYESRLVTWLALNS